MNISPVSSTNFKATINFPRSYTKYIKENSAVREGYANYASHVELVDKIKEAFRKNPSDANINVEMLCRPNELFCARGVVSSQYAKFVDIEPARDDSVAAYENIVRRILYPANRVQFNRLMGAGRKSAVQDAWWNEHIAPIWDKIQSEFYEFTVYQKIFDPLINANFRKQPMR